jgi:hypothetical protein
VNPDGRALLYRVQGRLSEQWGEALARMENPDAPRDLWREPFEAISWSDAISIVDALRHGFSAPLKFRNGGAKNVPSEERIKILHGAG